MGPMGSESVLKAYLSHNYGQQLSMNSTLEPCDFGRGVTLVTV